MKKVFLGGTCNGSMWREILTPLLKIGYFNPVVEDWTLECQRQELEERKNCDYCLYVITPKMAGVYAIAEVVDDSNKRPEKTIFCYLSEDDGQKFNDSQLKSLSAVFKLVERNGAIVAYDLEQVAKILNN